MGQQQLLLLVLGIVIVGLAVVVGIQAFGENQKKSNADALTNDAIRIASDAQAWSLKPEAFGGGDGDFQKTVDGTATDINFQDLGYDVGGTFQGGAVAATAYSNLNGVFTLTADDANTLTLTACHPSQANLVTVTVTGTTADDIQTVLENVEPTGDPAVINCAGYTAP